MPLTREQVETALDAGKLELYVTGRAKWYRARRNGRTKEWKTRPGHFRIPVKYMFKQCSYISHEDIAFEQPSMRIV